MSARATFRAAGLHCAVREDDEVICNVILAPQALDGKSPCCVELVQIVECGGDLFHSGYRRRVMNDDARRRDRIEIRRNPVQVISTEFWRYSRSRFRASTWYGRRSIRAYVPDSTNGNGSARKNMMCVAISDHVVREVTVRRGLRSDLSGSGRHLRQIQLAALPNRVRAVRNDKDQDVAGEWSRSVETDCLR